MEARLGSVGPSHVRKSELHNGGSFTFLKVVSLNSCTGVMVYDPESKFIPSASRELYI